MKDSWFRDLLVVPAVAVAVVVVVAIGGRVVSHCGETSIVRWSVELLNGRRVVVGIPEVCNESDRRQEDGEGA